MKFALTAFVSVGALVTPWLAQAGSDEVAFDLPVERDLYSPPGICCSPHGKDSCIPADSGISDVACDAVKGKWFEGGNCTTDCLGGCCKDFTCYTLSYHSCTHPNFNGMWNGFGVDCDTFVCPTPSPTVTPTTPPTPAPTTAEPTKSPTKEPTMAPTTGAPTAKPTPSPTRFEDGPGACCTPWDGCLDNTSQQSCGLLGGSFVAAGVNCTRGLCPDRGACCLDGGCTYEFKSKCNIAGGDFKGRGVMCGKPEDGVCPTKQPTFAPTPAPTPAPTAAPTKVPTTPSPTTIEHVPGACCLDSVNGGEICAELTRLDCKRAVGRFRGFGTVCDEKNEICLITDPPTPSPTVEPGAGGCCVPGFDRCFTTSFETCTKVNMGQWLGEGPTCTKDIVCPITEPPSPSPSGACCITLRNGLPYCLPDSSEQTCASQPGGQFVNGGNCDDIHCPITPSPTPSPPNPDDPEGPCCFPGDPMCYISSFTSCVLLSQGKFFGFGNTCDNIQCPGPTPTEPPTTPVDNKGACCLKNKRCLVLRQGNCLKRDGDFKGVGKPCGPNNSCPVPVRPTKPPTFGKTGACCLKTGRCLKLKPGNCKRRYGHYFGDGTHCGPNNTCPPDNSNTVGACCFPEKGLCRNLKGLVCKKRGGDFTPGKKCNKRTCPAAYGACCLSDNSCIVVKEKQCGLKKGHFVGLGTVCKPGTCPISDKPGACCLGTKGKCKIFRKAVCWRKGGKFKGGYCTPNTCPY